MVPSPRSLLPIHKHEIPHNASNGTATDEANPPAQYFPFVNREWRNEIVAAVAEFVGTFMFLFFAFGGTQVSYAIAKDRDLDTSELLFISLSFGFSLAVNVWVFFRVSGGLFNPAVTLGLYLIGAITWIRAIVCFVAQMLGGMAAAAVISAVIPGPLHVGTKLEEGTSIARGVFLEMFLTAQLVFTIFMLAAEKHKSTFLAPIGIGLSMFIAELVGVYYTGGSLNPTRSFGPCVVTHRFPGYHYIYWFGPIMGTLLAFGLYKMVKRMKYETVNPGQEFDDHEDALFDPPDNPTDIEDVQRPNPTAIAAEEAVKLASRSSGSRSDGLTTSGSNRSNIDEMISPATGPTTNPLAGIPEKERE